jgi:hypothetical protein
MFLHSFEKRKRILTLDMIESNVELNTVLRKNVFQFFPHESSTLWSQYS